MTLDDKCEKSRGSLPKNLIHLLSHSPMHTGAWDRVDYGDDAKHDKWQNLDRFGVYYDIYHACRYIVWLGKTLTNTTWELDPRRMFETVAHDLGATRTGLDVTCPSKTRYS